MLTGFHGLHVTLGTRSCWASSRFARCWDISAPTPTSAFEAVAWYWHFVDVVWLGLFIFVYVF